jgi:cell division FtsZ-interacting protein ZapD
MEVSMAAPQLELEKQTELLKELNYNIQKQIENNNDIGRVVAEWLDAINTELEDQSKAIFRIRKLTDLLALLVLIAVALGICNALVTL